MNLTDNSIVNYMLERTASLILTDCRCSSTMIDSSIELGVTYSKKKKIFYLPCLLAVNILRLWPSFKDVILSQLDSLYNFETKNIKIEKKINWNKTFENISYGSGDISFKEYSELLHNVENPQLYLVCTEYLIHIKEILNFYSVNEPPKDFIRVQSKLKSIEKTIQNTLDKIELSDALFDTKSKFNNIVTSEFENLLSNHWLNEKTIKQYFDKTFDFLASFEIYNFKQHAAIGWRDDYMSFNSGLGKGKDILVTPTTDIPHLFELWCFYEFIAALIKKKNYEIAQYCYINSNKNLELFSINNLGSIYYNYLGEKVINIPSKSSLSKILKRTCVEWYIEHMNMKIVFDTKFKKWNSGDNLTVLGYINDFGATAGVVIFSESFDSTAYNSDIGTDKIRCSIFSDKEKFIALQLTPKMESQKENEKTLSILVDYLF